MVRAGLEPAKRGHVTPTAGVKGATPLEVGHRRGYTGLRPREKVDVAPLSPNPIAGAGYRDRDPAGDGPKGGTMKRTLFVAAVAAVGVPVASTHFTSAAVNPQSAQSAALLEKVNVAASEFKFVLNKKTAHRGVVVFKVKNVGKIKHDFEIKGR